MFPRSKGGLFLLLPSLLFIGLASPVSAVERSRYPGVDSSLLSEPAPPPKVPYNPLSGPTYPLMQDSYFTDDSGNILMTVNVLGEVNRPGQLVVRESVDFASVMAFAGDVKNTANLGDVIVARKTPDSNGQQVYVLNLRKYYKHGDRSMFIALKPNDTIIVPEKGMTLDKLAKIAGITLAGFDIYSIMHNHQ